MARANCNRPQYWVGKPIIKNTRIAVKFVVDLLDRGWTTEQILDEYDHLTKMTYKPALPMRVKF